MQLEGHVAALLLACAVLHAGWNALVKGSRDPLLALATVIASAGLCLAPFAVALGPPPAQGWPWLAASVPLHAGYHLLLWQSYRLGDLSQVYPIARGSAPPLLAGLGACFAGEWLQPAELVGLAIASASIASLSLSGRSGRGGWPPAAGLALATGALTAAYSLVDGQGARAIGALHFVAWSNLLDVAPIALVVLCVRRGRVLAFLREDGARAAAGGALGSLTYPIVLWAMTRAPFAQVSMLRETSVIFGALIGTHFLKEPLGTHRTLAAAGVCAGVALLVSS